MLFRVNGERRVFDVMIGYEELGVNITYRVSFVFILHLNV